MDEDPGKQHDLETDTRKRDLSPKRHQYTEETQADTQSRGARQRFTQESIERPLTDPLTSLKTALSPATDQK